MWRRIQKYSASAFSVLVAELNLFNRREGVLKKAELHRGGPLWQLELWRRTWKQKLHKTKSEEDAHWDWQQLLDHASLEQGFLAYSLVCEDQIQGLMLLEQGITSRLVGARPKELIYVHRVSTAPWNRPTVVDVPQFAGVGTELLRAAILASEELGYEGRIGLHSLPQAEGFYRKLGMTALECDEDHEDLRYFEFSANLAQAFAGKLP